jgi:hypothetical protein
MSVIKCCEGSPLCGYTWNCKKYKNSTSVLETGNCYEMISVKFKEQNCSEYEPIKDKFTEEDGWVVK